MSDVFPEIGRPDRAAFILGHRADSGCGASYCVVTPTDRPPRRLSAPPLPILRPFAPGTSALARARGVISDPFIRG